MTPAPSASPSPPPHPPQPPLRASRLRVGIDLVQVSRIAESLATFGDRFLRRIYTDDEIAYARASASQTHERLAARFAAKEATRKALELDAVAFRDIEVRRAPSGACDIVLHGEARARADALFACAPALSMSHEGDHATAVVVVSCEPPQ